MKPNLTSLKLSLCATALLSVTIIGTSCNKSSSSVSSTNAAVNQQKLDVTNNAVDATSSDEENFALVAGNDQDVSDAKTAGKTVTYSPSKNVYPHTKTIDYGTGYTGSNGVVKSGKIIITYYDPVADAVGKYSFTTYENYHVDGILIEGTAQVNKIKNGTGQTVFLHIIHKTISDAAGDVKDYNTNAQWTVIDWQGGTANAYDITEHTTGNETYNGVESNNFKTSADDANHIIQPLTCKRRVKGGLIADVHLSNVAHGEPNTLHEYLDYGNGDCDDMGTLSVNGGPAETVTLPLRFWPLNH